MPRWNNKFEIKTIITTRFSRDNSLVGKKKIMTSIISRFHKKQVWFINFSLISGILADIIAYSVPKELFLSKNFKERSSPFPPWLTSGLPDVENFIFKNFYRSKRFAVNQTLDKSKWFCSNPNLVSSLWESKHRKNFQIIALIR